MLRSRNNIYFHEQQQQQHLRWRRRKKKIFFQISLKIYFRAQEQFPLKTDWLNALNYLNHFGWLRQYFPECTTAKDKNDKYVKCIVDHEQIARVQNSGNPGHFFVYFRSFIIPRTIKVSISTI